MNCAVRARGFWGTRLENNFAVVLLPRAGVPTSALSHKDDGEEEKSSLLLEKMSRPCKGFNMDF